MSLNPEEPRPATPATCPTPLPTAGEPKKECAAKLNKENAKDECVDKCKCIHSKNEQRPTSPSNQKPQQNPQQKPPSAGKTAKAESPKKQQPASSPVRSKAGASQAPNKSNKSNKSASGEKKRTVTKKGKATNKRPPSNSGDFRPGHDRCFEPYENDRLGKAFNFNNTYCPHVLMDNWRDSRVGTEHVINDHSHLEDYCFYRKPRFPEPLTMDMMKEKNMGGTGKGKMGYPFGYHLTKKDNMSTYQEHYNQYDCCSKKTLQPLLDFETGMVHSYKEPFQQRMKQYDPVERDRIDAININRYPDLGRLSYLVPHAVVECPYPAEQPKIPYHKGYSLQTSWPDNHHGGCY